MLPLVASSRPSAVGELSRPRRSRVAHDGGGRAVLDRAAGVGPLGLAQNLNAGQMRGQRVQAHQRRIADAFQHVGSERFGQWQSCSFRAARVVFAAIAV